MYERPVKKLDDRTMRFQIAVDTRLLCWAEVLALWTDSPEFADEFSAALGASRFSAFRWETPPLRSRRCPYLVDFYVFNDDAHDVSTRARSTIKREE